MSGKTETWDQSDVVRYALSDDSQLPIVTHRLGRPHRVNIWYSDINSTFRQDSQDLIVYDSNAINRQINNVLSTPLYSDDFEPLFGSLLPYRLFDPITPLMAYLLRNDTIDAIGKWMNSKILMDTRTSDVTIINSNPDYEGYFINMRYQIRRTKAVATYSLAFVR